MHGITVSFPCAMGRFLGSFEDIRCDLCSFPEKFFFTLSVFTRRKMGETRSPDRSARAKEGRAKLVELPVSGWLGGDNLLTTQATDLKKRLTSNTDVDIFQMYWHHYEFAHEELDWVKGNLDEAEQFLIRFGLIDSVRFSTAKEAVDDWKDQRS
jgi:hypothetical protein